MFYSIDLMTFCGSSEPKLTSTVILKRAFDNFSLKYSSYFHKNTNTGRENYLNLYQINSSTPLVNCVSHTLDIPNLEFGIQHFILHEDIDKQKFQVLV